MRAEPTLLFRQQVPRLAVGAESRSDDLEKDLARVRHEGNATIVTALCSVLLLVENLYHRISPSLRYFSLVLHQLDHPVELLEHGRVMVYPEFEEFNREFVWSHCLRICHRPQGPDQLAFCRFDPELVCDRPLGGSSMMSVNELELWNLKAEGTTRLRIVGLADETELVSLAIRY